MKLFKRTLAASAALLFLLSFGGCAQESTPQSVVATVDGTPIYRWEVDYQYSKNISYYESYQDLDTENPETIQMLKESILQALIQDTAMNLDAEEQGYCLTYEEIAQVDAEYAELRQTTIQKYADLYYDGDLEKGEEYYIQNLTDQNASEEVVINSMYNQAMRLKMSEDMYASLGSSDEAVRAYYDSEVEADKVTYSADLAKYESDNAYDTYAVMYTPEDYVRVKQILIAMPEGVYDQILSLVQELATMQNELAILSLQKGENDSSVIRLRQDVEEKEQELEQVRNDGWASIKARAEECLNRLKAGEDFETLLNEYGEDEAMKSAPYGTLGYLMCAKSTSYDSRILEAAMSLENIGDYTTELIATDYGYHILTLVDKIEKGPRELDDELYDWINEHVVQYADRTEIYNETVQKAMEGREIVTYTDLLQ